MNNNTKGCGKILGHGEVCYEGYLCSVCTSNESLLDKFIREMEIYKKTDEWKNKLAYITNREVIHLEEENEKLKQAIKKLDLIIESDKFEGWSDQYHEMRQVIDSLKESNEKK